jgi:hypothetical protein
MATDNMWARRTRSPEPERRSDLLCEISGCLVLVVSVIESLRPDRGNVTLSVVLDIAKLALTAHWIYLTTHWLRTPRIPSYTSSSPLCRGRPIRRQPSPLLDVSSQETTSLPWKPSFWAVPMQSPWYWAPCLLLYRASGPVYTLGPRETSVLAVSRFSGTADC